MYTELKTQIEQGIAIAPILFVVAILAVLVGAIAGSDKLGLSSSSDAERINASIVIQQGNLILAGAQRLAAAGVDPETIEANSFPEKSDYFTTGTLSVFSPDGGGVDPLFVPLAARKLISSSGNPGGGRWSIIGSARGTTIGGIGINSEWDLIAATGVNYKTCVAINKILTGTAGSWGRTGGSGTTLNTSEPNKDGVDVVKTEANMQPRTFTLPYPGRQQACVTRTPGDTTTPVYYQVLQAR